MKLFKRQAYAVFDGKWKVGEGLRLDFEVEKTAKAEPNKLRLGIANLSEQTRARLRKGTSVMLFAGYQGGASVIFSGEIRTVETAQSGGDLITTIRSGDGDGAYRKATFSGSFAGPVASADVIAKMAKALGIDAEQAVARVKAKGLGQYPHGFSATGVASTELSKVLAAQDLGWSIQDGKLQILAANEVAPGSAILLTHATGLIDSPELNAQEGTDASGEKKKSPPLLKLKSLLQPQIRPGVAIQVKARSYDGLFRAENVRHSGDTRGTEFYSEIEAKEVKR